MPKNNNFNSNISLTKYQAALTAFQHNGIVVQKNINEQWVIEQLIDLLRIKNILGTPYIAVDYANATPVWEEDTDYSRFQKFLLDNRVIGLRNINEIEKITKVLKVNLKTNQETYSIKEDQVNSVFFSNGVLKPTGFEPYTESQFTLFTLNFPYSNEVNQQKFDRLDKVISNIFPDPEVKKFALACYYTCLIPKCFELALFNYGQGSNGKTWLMDLLANIIGAQYVGNFKSGSAGDKFALQDAENKLMLLQQEGSRDILDPALIKEATTNGLIGIEKKGEKSKKVVNYSTLITNTNVPPAYNDSSKGIFRRLVVIPYDADNIRTAEGSFNDYESQNVLTDTEYHLCFIKLMYDAFVELYDEKSEDKIKRPEQIIRLTQDLAEKNIATLDWLRSDLPFNKMFKEQNKETIFVPNTELYDMFSEWFRQYRNTGKIISKQRFLTEELYNALTIHYKKTFSFKRTKKNYMKETKNWNGQVVSSKRTNGEGYEITLIGDLPKANITDSDNDSAPDTKPANDYIIEWDDDDK